MKTQRFTRAGYLFLALLLPLALTRGRPALHAQVAGPDKTASLPALAQAPISALIGADQSIYHARMDGTHFRMDNPEQGLSAEFSADGMQVGAGVHSWGLTLEGYGYGESLQPLPDADPTARDNRLEYARGPLTEWYLNGPFGLEQGFTLSSPPAVMTGGPLTLALIQGGDLQAKAGEGDKELVLTAPSGEAVLGYTGLLAYDADGRELQTWLEIRAGVNGRPSMLLLRLDDHAARYPLTVDPFVQKAKLTALDKTDGDEFGCSVAISGDVAVVGARSADLGSLSDAGAAYVFVKPANGWGNMTQTAKLTASDKAAGDNFGYSVSTSGDVVVVGASSADPGGTIDAGAAYVFVKPGGGWADMTQTAKLTASDKAAFDYFGYSVAISGDVVLVGAYKADPGGTDYAGAAYVFVKMGGGWADMTQTAKLTASDKAAYDYFGYSVAISGDVVVVGSPYSDPGGTSSAGVAYVFVKPGGGWTDMTQTASLTASYKAQDDYFGSSVSISADIVVVGAYGADPGGMNTAGAAYIFVKPGGGWADMTQTARLTTSDMDTYDQFGWSVSISGDVVVVGALGADPGGTVSAGAAYVFVKPGGGWADMTQTAKLTALDKAENDYFGWSVSNSGGVVLVGAYGADPGGTGDAGAAYIFFNCYTTTTTITSDSPDPSLVGGTVNVSVTVSGGSTTPGGTVDISGTDTNCSITLSGGSGNCDVTFDTVGAKTLTATYTGDTTHAGSSDTEDHAVKANTTTTITSDAPDPSTDGQNVTVNFTVTVNPPGSGTPTGDVTVSDGVDSCSASVAAGSCVLVLNTLGTRSLTATYPGDTDFNGSSDTEGHQVTPRTSNFYSAGTYDGWILESSETSSLGGSINASETTFRLGDDASDRQYRSILSFNTASLPDNAVITSVVLKIKKQGLVGTNPFTTHQGLKADIRKPYFGTALGLAASDFQALASISSVGTFGTTPSAGWYSVTLSSTARPYINKTGTTQFRLRFQKDDNDDMGADYLKFYSGNAGTASRPVLIIQYYVP